MSAPAPTPRILVVGSINADESVRLARLPGPGETVGARTVETALGGKGANQAVAAARAGAEVSMVGAVGPDGDLVLAALAADGIDTAGVSRLTDVPTGRAIVLVDDSAENSIVVIPGANHAIPSAAVADAVSRLGPGDTVLLQHEVPAEVSKTAARAARAAGATVVWNAAPAPTSRDELVADVDLLVVNEHELLAVAGLLGDQDPAGLATADLIALVADRMRVDVVCTLGADGAAYLVDGVAGSAPARRVDAVDTTAAGDTFVGYLAAAAAGPFAERLGRALTAGSLTVTRSGASASIPTRAEVDALALRTPTEMSHA